MYTEFHTWKEILQQPDMWLKTFDIVKNRKDEISAFVKKYVEAGYEIVLTGAGTSAYIGDALHLESGYPFNACNPVWYPIMSPRGVEMKE